LVLTIAIPVPGLQRIIGAERPETTSGDGIIFVRKQYGRWIKREAGR
jgi:hypothetical protein